MRITQTQKNRADHWLFGGNPNAIYAQEAEGQQELINSSQLPVKSNDRLEPNAKVAYKKMGILVHPFTDKIARIFKDQVNKLNNDPIFVSVILPPGWKISDTNHSMWNNLVDHRDRIRANIFYKAAFYDRSAHINFIRRYAYTQEFIERDDINDMRSRYVIKDNATGNQLFVTETRNTHDWESRKAECEGWLNEYFPKWQELTAYWDQ